MNAALPRGAAAQKASAAPSPHPEASPLLPQSDQDFGPSTARPLLGKLGFPYSTALWALCRSCGASPRPQPRFQLCPSPSARASWGRRGGRMRAELHQSHLSLFGCRRKGRTGTAVGAAQPPATPS